MNKKLFIHCLKFQQIIHYTTWSTHRQILAKRISWAPGLLLAVNSLQL